MKKQVFNPVTKKYEWFDCGPATNAVDWHRVKDVEVHKVVALAKKVSTMSKYRAKRYIRAVKRKQEGKTPLSNTDAFVRSELNQIGV